MSGLASVNAGAAGAIAAISRALDMSLIVLGGRCLGQIIAIKH